MRKITGQDFASLIEEDPDWAANLTEPVEVTTMCKIPNSPITGLSKHLVFSGTNDQGVCADFTGCMEMANAYGTFHGSVVVSRSGIATLEGLNILKPDKDGNALVMIQCGLIKDMTGTFPGCVTVSHCENLEVIHDFEVTGGNNNGHAASFTSCSNLKAASGTYYGSVSFDRSGIEAIENLKVCGTNKEGHAANFEHCQNLTEATGNYPGFVSFKLSGVQKIKDLTITGCSTGTGSIYNGWSANFSGCSELKKAEGTFAGKVTFESSSIESVTKLQASHVVLKECRLLTHCPDSILKRAEIDGVTAARIQKMNQSREALKQPTIEL